MPGRVFPTSPSALDPHRYAGGWVACRAGTRWHGRARAMTPRVELVLTFAVCAIGCAYFGWRLLTAEGDRQLLYIGILILGAILAHRAIKDVRARGKRPTEDTDGGNRPD